MKQFVSLLRRGVWLVVVEVLTAGWGIAESESNAGTVQAQHAHGALEILAQTIERQIVGGKRRNSEDAIPPTYADVAYGPRERNTLDFWRAESDTPTPLVVYFHGGGFCGGDKSEFSRNTRQLRRCLDNAVSAATVNYPFVFTDDLLTVMYDAARAVQFLRHNAASWNIDPKRVAVFGESAGAGMSLWLAFRDDLADPENPDPILRESTRVVAAGALAPQATYDFSTWPNFLVLPPWLWDTCSGVVCPLYYHIENKDLDTEAGVRMRQGLDIVSFIDPLDPPILLRSMYDSIPSNSWDHMLHHPGHAVLLHETCRTHGVPSTLVTRETPQEERVDVMDFLFEHLGVMATR